MHARKRPSWLKRLAGPTLAIGAAAALFGTQGCLDRPVVPIKPGSTALTNNKVTFTKIDKIDLLLVIDNSLSMADKQAELAKRVPELVGQLTNPAEGTKGISDMHVGVVTSSLGSHGTAACDPKASGGHPEFNDRGRLLPRSDTVAASPLTWRQDGASGVKFSGPSTELQTETGKLVSAASELGCGYEETWEAMYHFLIDPAPYETADATACTGSGTGQRCEKIVPKGIDQELLKQRAEFLRPDSLLAIIVLSDENDMSLKPVDLNWIPWGVEKRFAQLRGSEECKGVPDELEPENQDELTKLGCRTCLLNPDMPICNTPWPNGADPNVDSDDRNLRGFHQVQRFGYNFLYSRSRYVSALSNPDAPVADVSGNTKDGNGKPYVNPIYKDGRTPDLVVVATIVGVPRQFVEDEKGNIKTPEWDKIVGPLSTRDVHMIESIEMRNGIGKYNGDIKADDPMCADGLAGCGNGGDRVIPGGSDLQFACIAEREDEDDVGPLNTDCPKAAEGTALDDIAKNPLCKGAGKQPFFKAYPGLRHLRIAQALGDQGFVASICNKTFTKAVAGIVAKLGEVLNSQCFSSVLTPKCSTGEKDCADEEKAVDCLLVESFSSAQPDTRPDKSGKCESLGVGYCTPGAEPCRSANTTFPPLSPTDAAKQIVLRVKAPNADGVMVDSLVQAREEGGNVVLGDGDKARLLCEQVQLVQGRDLGAGNQADPRLCATQAGYQNPNGGGYCYTTNRNVVPASCLEKNSPGAMQFIGQTTPRNGSDIYTVCQK